MNSSPPAAARGSALLAALILGFAVFALITAALTTAARLQEAGEQSEQAAQHAAAWGARYGDVETTTQIAESLAADSTVTVSKVGSEFTVEVAVDVPLLGPLRGLSYTVRSSATAQASPYRSRP